MKRRSPCWRGVGMLRPERTSIGAVQKSLPLSGSSELIDSGCQMISCFWPPASIIVGGQYPGSLAERARQSSLPVSLSNATATLPCPPTRQINLLPSTSGCPAKPHNGVCTSKSFLNSRDQITFPEPQSKQNRWPSAPSV